METFQVAYGPQEIVENTMEIELSDRVEEVVPISKKWYQKWLKVALIYTSILAMLLVILRYDYIKDVENVKGKQLDFLK